jgi:hypothetical protein
MSPKFKDREESLSYSCKSFRNALLTARICSILEKITLISYLPRAGLRLVADALASARYI